MSRNEIIESRKGMSNEEVIKAVLGEMSDKCKAEYRQCSLEYRNGRRNGIPYDEIVDLVGGKHDALVRYHLLEEIIETLDDRCSAYVNGIDYLA